MAKEYRIEGFHLHSDPLPLTNGDEIITLAFKQTRLLEVYAPSNGKRRTFDAMKHTLVAAIEILHPRLPEDFFKDFSG